MTENTMAGLLAGFTVPTSALGRKKEIGRGASGVVYQLRGARVPGLAGDLAYKEYRAGGAVASVSGLVRIIQAVEQLQAEQRRFVEHMTVWPLRVVVDDGGDAAGILMRLIPGRFFEDMRLPSGGRARITREVQHLIVAPELSRRHEIDVPAADDAETRLRLCERLSFLLSILHGGDLVYGDLSARNILYALDPEPAVLLVDCDAARRHGSAAVNKQANSPDWDPPETVRASQLGHPLPQTQDTDRYKLALFVLRCLTPGKGSSINRNPARAHAMLDRDGRELLRRGLQGPADRRPRAIDWWRYLAMLLGDGPSPGPRVLSGWAHPAAMPPGAEHLGWERAGPAGSWVARSVGAAVPTERPSAWSRP
jgi:hypothetical protein